MYMFSKVAAMAFAAGLLTGPAAAIDPFFPTFGNNGIDVRHYHLELGYKPGPGELKALAFLQIRALENLSRFTLDLAGLEVDSVWAEGRPAGFTQANDKLTVIPRRAIEAGDRFVLAVVYHGTPQPIQDPTVPGDPDYQLGWFKYRSAAYVVSEPVGASTFYPANDEPTDKATFTFGITVPAAFTGVANGVLTSTHRIGMYRRFQWEMRRPMTTWLATVHVNKFDLNLTRSRDGVPVRVYSTEATPPEDVAGYALAGRMITYFRQLIGRYPFASYGSVVVDDVPRLYYALETQTMSTFPLGAADEGIVAHELAHQWFGNSVSVKRWKDLWMAEGPATYFEVLWLNRNDPDAFQAAMEGNHDYIVAQDVGPAVVDDPENLFSDAVYYRGAVTLYALQLKVGDEKFFRILRRYLSDFRNRNATSEDFIDTAVKVSGDGSVRPFLRAWLYHDAVPPLSGTMRPRPRGPVAKPDIVGGRCGPGSHRGAPRTCG
jgi:aminopeptidase N